eukprot:UN24516
MNMAPLSPNVYKNSESLTNDFSNLASLLVVKTAVFDKMNNSQQTELILLWQEQRDINTVSNPQSNLNNVPTDRTQKQTQPPSQNVLITLLISCSQNSSLFKKAGASNNMNSLLRALWMMSTLTSSGMTAWDYFHRINAYNKHQNRLLIVQIDKLLVWLKHVGMNYYLKNLRTMKKGCVI